MSQHERNAVPVWELRGIAGGDDKILRELAAKDIGIQAFGSDQAYWLPVDPSPNPTTWMIDFYEVAYEMGFIEWDPDRGVHVELRPRAEYNQVIMVEVFSAWWRERNAKNEGI